MVRPTVALLGAPDRGGHTRPTYAHDHCLTVMDGGGVISHLELERHTRAKQDNRLPELFADLVEAGVIELPDEFDLVFVNVCHAHSFRSTCGRFHLTATAPKELFGDLLPARIEAWPQGAGRPHDVFLCQHELAHVSTALAFAGAFPDNALLVHFDGGASRSNFSAFYCRHSQSPIEPLVAHWDMVETAELFSSNSVAVRVLGLAPEDHLSIGGKLMGLASYGRAHPALAEFLERSGLTRRDCNDYEAVLAEAQHVFGYAEPASGPDNELSQDIAAAF